MHNDSCLGSLLWAMWPDAGFKNCLISPQIAQKVATHFLNKRDIIRNSPKSHQNIWTTFARQFVAKNLQKIVQSGDTGCAQLCFSANMELFLFHSNAMVCRKPQWSLGRAFTSEGEAWLYAVANLHSTKQVNLLLIQLKQSSWIQTNKTGSQP